MSVTTFTLKVELRFNTEKDEERKDYWKKIYDWRSICVMGANAVSSHLYYALNKSTFIYLRKKEEAIQQGKDIKDKDVQKSLYNEVSAEMAEDLVINDNTGKPISSTNTTYQLLSHLYKGKIPTAILTCLNSVVVGTFNKQKLDYFLNKRAVSNYKDTMPIPVPSANIRNLRKESIFTFKTINDNSQNQKTETREYPSFAFTLFDIPFICRFGRDKSMAYPTFEKAVSAHLLPEWITSNEKYLSDLIIGTPNTDFTIEYEGGAYQFKLITTHTPSKKKGDPGTTTFHYLVNVKSQSNGMEYSFMMLPVKKNKIAAWAIESDYHLCDSSISIERKLHTGNDGKERFKTKIYLNAVIQKPVERKELDEKNIAVCTLSPSAPITVTFEGREHFIGDYSRLKWQRIAFQGLYKRKQGLRVGGGGHGTGRKLKPLEYYRSKERRFFQNRAHELARNLVDFCLLNKIKHIHLTGVQQTLDAADYETRKSLIRNWGWNGFYTKANYKANAWGMVVKMDKEAEDNSEEYE